MATSDGEVGSNLDAGESVTAASESQVVLRRLVRLLEDYDAVRVQLESKGGAVADIKKVTALLHSEVKVGRLAVCLADPTTLRNLDVLPEVFGLHVEVRTTCHGMPIYYVCRVRFSAWFDAPGVVVEDVYRSPGYPVPDPRFDKLMDLGRVCPFLRAAPMRERAWRLLRAATGRGEAGEVDRLLCAAGTHVLSAAWHEDQRLAIEVSQHMDIPILREAIETLYLVLQSDLCELRAHVGTYVNPYLGPLLSAGYAHGGLARVLGLLPDLDGERLEVLPVLAERAYRELAGAFATFLRTPVAWREEATKNAQPLYKTLLANARRLGLIAPLIAPTEDLAGAKRELAERARAALAIVGLGDVGHDDALKDGPAPGCA